MVNQNENQNEHQIDASRVARLRLANQKMSGYKLPLAVESYWLVVFLRVLICASILGLAYYSYNTYLTVFAVTGNAAAVVAFLLVAALSGIKFFIVPLAVRWSVNGKGHRKEFFTTYKFLLVVCAFLGFTQFMEILYAIDIRVVIKTASQSGLVAKANSDGASAAVGLAKENVKNTSAALIAIKNKNGAAAATLARRGNATTNKALILSDSAAARLVSLDAQNAQNAQNAAILDKCFFFILIAIFWLFSIILEIIIFDSSNFGDKKDAVMPVITTNNNQNSDVLKYTDAFKVARQKYSNYMNPNKGGNTVTNLAQANDAKNSLLGLAYLLQTEHNYMISYDTDGVPVRYTFQRPINAPDI